MFSPQVPAILEEEHSSSEEEDEDDYEEDGEQEAEQELIEQDPMDKKVFVCFRC